MRVKMIILGLILVIIVSTVVLQIEVYGNYEEMEEKEYDEFQIKIDYNRMLKGIESLFSKNPRLSTSQQDEEEAQPQQTVSPESNTVPGLQPMPTLKVLPEMIRYGEE